MVLGGGAVTYFWTDLFVKLPTNNYEKVLFAFNGVEKSFKQASKAQKMSADKDVLSGNTK